MRSLPSLEEARALGARLRVVDPALLKPVPFRRTWLRGGEPYLEATVDEDERGLLRLELYVRSRYARFSRERGLETGATDEHEIETGAPTSHVEGRDRTVDRAVLDVARAIAEACPALAPYAARFAPDPPS